MGIEEVRIGFGAVGYIAATWGAFHWHAASIIPRVTAAAGVGLAFGAIAYKPPASAAPPKLKFTLKKVEAVPLWPIGIISLLGGADAWRSLPILKVGNTDSEFIDFITPDQMKEPIMRGVDVRGRPFLALRVKFHDDVAYQSARDERVHDNPYQVVTVYRRYAPKAREPFDPWCGDDRWMATKTNLSYRVFDSNYFDDDNQGQSLLKALLDGKNKYCKVG